jgi:hypothetical protein
MLQFSGHSLLLVHRVIAGVGTTEPYRNLLAPSSGAVGCVPFRDGYRLPCTVFLLSGIGLIRFNALWVWLFIVAGVGIAFLLEWLYTKRSAP